MGTQEWTAVCAIAALGACEAEHKGSGGDDGIELADDGAAESDADRGDDSSDPPPNDDDGGPAITLQSVFTFTIPDDRRQFTEHDLVYAETIGPYAIYEVTGPAPRLEGPLVELNPAAKWTMMCAAAEYFAALADGGASSAVLRGGRTGELVLTALALAPEGEDGCSDPADHFNDRDPGVNVETNPLDRLVVSFEPAPAIGSRVLLRQAGIVFERPGHNDSHVIPSVCCEGSTCELEP